MREGVSHPRIFSISFNSFSFLLLKKRLDLATEKITNLGCHKDSISSMTFARSSSAS
jgi:hypothetical protein